MVCSWPRFFLDRYLCVRTCMWCMVCRAFLLLFLHICCFSFRLIAASWSLRHARPHQPVGLVVPSSPSVPLLPQHFPLDDRSKTLAPFYLLCCSSPLLKNRDRPPGEVRPSEVFPVAFRSPHGTGETAGCPNGVRSVSRCAAQNSPGHFRGWGSVAYLTRCRLNATTLAGVPHYVTSLYRRGGEPTLAHVLLMMKETTRGTAAMQRHVTRANTSHQQNDTPRPGERRPPLRTGTRRMATDRQTDTAALSSTPRPPTYRWSPHYDAPPSLCTVHHHPPQPPRSSRASTKNTSVPRKTSKDTLGAVSPAQRDTPHPPRWPSARGGSHQANYPHNAPPTQKVWDPLTKATARSAGVGAKRHPRRRPKQRGAWYIHVSAPRLSIAKSARMLLSSWDPTLLAPNTS